jgi:hypothetical protein
MSGKSRLPGGAIRKASQRRSRPAATPLTAVRPTWRPGDRVQWRHHSGTYQRDVGDGLVDIDIAGRVYRVQRSELRLG